MTRNDLEGFEPGLVLALVSMMNATIGPAFDLADLQAIAGVDPTLILGPFASAYVDSAEQATTDAMDKIPHSFDDPKCASGIVSHVIVGPEIGILNSVRTVAGLLRSKTHHDIGLICGASIDPAKGRQVKVVLWAR